jgi:hypothetical protein
MNIDIDIEFGMYFCRRKTLWKNCLEQENLKNHKMNRVQRTALFSVITQRVVVISYRRFGTNYQSYLQGSRIQKRHLLGSRTLQKRRRGYLETSVCNYHHSLRSNPEERSSQQLRGRSLKLTKNQVQYIFGVVVEFFCDSLSLILRISFILSHLH